MDEQLNALFREIVREINRADEGGEPAGRETDDSAELPYGLDPETIEILLDDSISTGG